MNRYINENDKKMDELLQKYIAGNASEKESQRHTIYVAAYIL